MTKDAARATVDFVTKQAAYHEAERTMKEATARAVLATRKHEGARQAILSQLESSAPPELAEALDDLSFIDTLLRGAIRTDVVKGRNWLGQQMHTVDSNLDAIAAARKKNADAQGEIRELARSGRMLSDDIVARCAEILAAAVELAFEFIPRKLWELRHSKPGSDIAAEVVGRMQ